MNTSNNSYGSVTQEEVQLWRTSRNPVDRQMQRIIRTINSRQVSFGFSAPPPIVSRIYQELSNGMLAYNQCTKLKEVPTPFAYVQLNAMLLNIFIIFAPIIMCAEGSLMLLSQPSL